MLQSQPVARSIGLPVANPETELALHASADLDAAAAAWLAFATMRELYRVQPEDENRIALNRYERSATHLADEFDRAAAAFRRSDNKLRQERERWFGPSDLPEAQPLVALIVAMDVLKVPADDFARFVSKIGGVPSIALLDQHGLSWIGRFLTRIDYPFTDATVSLSARPEVAASRAQVTALRAMFAVLEGDDAGTDRRLTAYIAGRHEITDISELDELTAWKEIVRMRERIAAWRAEAD